MSEKEQRRDGEGVLAAWSRRKRAAARAAPRDKDAAAEAAETAAEVEADTDPASQAAPEISAEDLAALPPIDEITGTTDLQPFMKRAVPEALRKAALRKVWLSNALIRDHDDPAVDYAWDWNAPEGVPGAGGVLQRDKVAKMMDDLINRDRPEPGRKAPEDQTPEAGDSTPEGEEYAARDEAPADQQEDGAPQVAPALPASPVRRTGTPGTREPRSKDVSDPETAESQAQQGNPASTPMPARRHGSAIPE